MKIENWTRKKDPYLQIFYHFVSFDILEWILLEQVDEYEMLSNFLSSEKCKHFYTSKDFLEFVAKYTTRFVVGHKECLIFYVPFSV